MTSPFSLSAGITGREWLFFLVGLFTGFSVAALLRVT